jgi:hypothetical protein
MALLLEPVGVEAAEAPVGAWDEEGAVVVGLDVPAELAPEDPPPETVRGDLSNSGLGEEV